MRTRNLVVAALLVAPSVAVAQRTHIPTRGGIPEPAPLPPSIPVVNEAITIKQTRWSVEGYSLLSAIQVPVEGGMTSYTMIGAGTHGGYRLTDGWSTTFDLTASAPFGGSMSAQTAEVGARYIMPAWDRGVRPFFDARADFMNLHDSWNVPTAGGQGVQYARMSRGFGAVGGAGLEVPLTSSFAVSSGVTAMRNRMSVYSITGPSAVPDVHGYWMTSLRWALGIRWNPATSVQARQNSRHENSKSLK